MRARKGVTPSRQVFFDKLVTLKSKRVLSSFLGQFRLFVPTKNDRNSDNLNWKIYQKSSFFLTTISTPLRDSSDGGLLSN